MESSGILSRVLGLLGALLGLGAYVLWWYSQGNPTNPITITLALAFLLLIAVHVMQLSLGSRSRASVTLTLVATGLWIFLATGTIGLMFAATLIRGSQLVASTFTVQMLYAAAGIALYAVALLGVRYRWILRPIAQIHGANIAYPAEPEPNNYPRISPFSDGYFVYEHRLAHTKQLNRIREATASKLIIEAIHVLALAKNVPSVKADYESLTSLIAKRECARKQSEKTNTAVNSAACEDRIRRLALVLTISVANESRSRTIYLMKVQNQLAIVALILLVAVGAFSATGWIVPMSLAAIAALIFRIRSLMPIGDPSSYDGGARWMALFITPLLGAVSAVIGLYAIAALAQGEILSDSLGEKLQLPHGLGIETSPQHFSIVALGIAIAFGWSARLLDTMLGKLSDSVSKIETEQATESESAPSASAEKAASNDDCDICGVAEDDASANKESDPGQDTASPPKRCRLFVFRR